MVWHKIKSQKPYQPMTIEADPIGYAIKHDLIGDHSTEARAKIGAWRWRGIWEHRTRIFELLEGAERAVDFGGTAAPVGYGAVVVDREEDAQNGLRALYDVKGPVDLVFTSHTLEHIANIDICLLSITGLLRKGGHIVAHVPSWRNNHLRAENWPHHEQTFCLGSCAPPKPYVPLDSLLEQYGFRVELAEHTSDGANIIVIAERK